MHLRTLCVRARAQGLSQCSSTLTLYRSSALDPPPLQTTMIGAACLFLAGAGLQAGAVNLGMLIAGRVLVGCGVGECAGCRRRW